MSESQEDGAEVARDGDEAEIAPDAGGSSAARRALARVKAADRKPGVLRALGFVRGLAPGDERLGGDRRDSATRELGLTALQVWQSISEAQGRGRGERDVAILFTDLVDYSRWALEVGDTAAISLLDQVGDAVEDPVADHGGTVVKRLGDGLMAVFSDPGDAIEAALEALERVDAIDHDGYRPVLRAGLHLGRPRRLRGDYLGVDVNVAARVLDAAGDGRLLMSGPVLEQIDASAYEVKRRRRFKAKGAPRELEVYEVSRTAQPGD